MDPFPQARVTNALGDLVLGGGHVYALALLPRGKGLMYWLVALYFVTLFLFQWIGAYFHIVSPGGPDSLELPWLLYLSFGCLAPCLYGAALSLDVLESERAVKLWLLSGLAYLVLVLAQLDLADYTHLPRSFEIVLPASLARKMTFMSWMPSALRANGLAEFNNSSSLVLKFDGRGYARVPFDGVFDAVYSSERDLVAALPCWRTDSLPFLMLCFGVVANATHLLICLAKRRTHPRAKRNLLAHAFMKIALFTMPVAMLLGGINAGIDWMHACAAPAMWLQAKSCLECIRETSRRHRGDVDVKFD